MLQLVALRSYDFLQKFNQQTLGPLYRNIGQRLLKQGINLQGDYTSTEKLVPSLRKVSHNKQTPDINTADFVAPNAAIIGNVQVGEGSSVWYNSTIRGDLGQVKVGNYSVIQDLTNIVPSKSPVQIGNEVVLSPNVSVYSSKIDDEAFVGMGATIQQNCHIQSNSVIAAGSVVKQGTKVPARQIWAGSPAQYLRDITAEELDVINEHKLELSELAKIHDEETEKTFRQILNDQQDSLLHQFCEEEDAEALTLARLGMPIDDEEQNLFDTRAFIETQQDRGRVAGKPFDVNEEYYDPYEQDLSSFPDEFKLYKPDFEQQAKKQAYFDNNPNIEAEPALKNTFVERGHSYEYEPKQRDKGRFTERKF